MRVIGTAGHVDHGKSTLIRALTGIDPDRLQEEKDRGMTIDLGFAWMRLPGGEEASIVDVPGHERFIKNMLAGIGGIDTALLVVAADEGVMPQTREHLAILDLLGVQSGAVAITKRDLVDGDWLDLVTAEVEETLADTSLAKAALIPVSSTTGHGLDELRAELDRLLGAERWRRQTGWPRLPVDRVFTMSGFGTVVTGTLVDGELHVGEEIEILPAGRKARIRGLQSHRKEVETAPAGTRVAVNLSGVSTEEVERGDVITSPGWLRATRVVDVRLRAVADAPRPIAHNARVTFHTGATEASGKVSFLDRAELVPGEVGWAQIRLGRPVAVARSDLFILRVPSPSMTVGGGVIVDDHPKRHRRFQEKVLQQLGVLERGSPEEVLLQTLQTNEPADLGELARRSSQSVAETRTLLEPLIARGTILALDGAAPSQEDPGSASGKSEAALAPTTPLISLQGWNRIAGRVRMDLEAYHQAHHLRRGMPREELRKRLGLDPRVFTRVERRLLEDAVVVETGPLVSLPVFVVILTDEERRAAAAVVGTLQSAGAAPPGRSELRAQHRVPDEVIQALVDDGTLVEVGQDLVYLRPTYDEIVTKVTNLIQASGTITVAQVRDAYSTSRKYALAILEHLDERKITRRIGDERVLTKAP